MLSKLKIIILESPYTTMIDNEFAKNLFSQMAELKIKGYVEMYKFGVLPLDSADFIGTHLLVCEERNGVIDVLMGYKSTTYSACKDFNIPFSILNIVKENAASECTYELNKVLDKCEQEGVDISYDTSWTINPKVRKNKLLQNVLKDLTCALLVHHHRDYNIPYWLTFGICKYKTDKYFEMIGAKEVSRNPLLKQPVLFGAEAKMMICKTSDYTEFALRIAQKYRSMWDARTTISVINEEKVQKAA